MLARGARLTTVSVDLVVGSAACVDTARARNRCGASRQHRYRPRGSRDRWRWTCRRMASAAQRGGDRECRWIAATLGTRCIGGVNWPPIDTARPRCGVDTSCAPMSERRAAGDGRSGDRSCASPIANDARACSDRRRIARSLGRYGGRRDTVDSVSARPGDMRLSPSSSECGSPSTRRSRGREARYQLASTSASAPCSSSTEGLVLSLCRCCVVRLDDHAAGAAIAEQLRVQSAGHEWYEPMNRCTAGYAIRARRSGSRGDVALAGRSYGMKITTDLILDAMQLYRGLRRVMSMPAAIPADRLEEPIEPADTAASRDALEHRIRGGALGAGRLDVGWGRSQRARRRFSPVSRFPTASKRAAQAVSEEGSQAAHAS